MEEILSDFDNVQWCQDILNDPNIKQLRSNGRLPPPPWDKNAPNTLLNETFRTEKTIRAWVALASREKNNPRHASRDFILLLSLGTGLSGFKDYAHGGFSALILDQAMSICSSLAIGPSGKTIDFWSKFKKPLKIPTIIQCKAVVTKVEGRRAFVISTIEDGEGNVYCEAGSTWMLPKDHQTPKI